jgi:hypothetical protein
MMSIFDEVLKQKTAASPTSVGQQAVGFGKHMGRALAGGAGAGVAAAALSGAGIAAGKIYDAVTKARDFRAMMGSSFNADLSDLHKQRPREFNEAFTSLRTMNPAFTKDPMVAGVYLRRMMSFAPEDAGGTLLDALRSRKDVQESPVFDSFQRAGTSTAGGMMGDFMRPPRRLSETDMQEQAALERMKAQVRAEFKGGPESTKSRRGTFSSKPETYGGTPDPTR